MFENDGLLDFDYIGLADFGVFHLNVNDAAELIAKIISLEGMSDVVVPDADEFHSIHSQELTNLISNQIAEYRKMLLSGIDKGTLETVQIRRNPDESIISEETFVNASVLTDWLAIRNIELEGDWYAEYMDQELQVAESAALAINIERINQRNPKSRFERYSDDENIARLEKIINSLKFELHRKRTSKRSTKPLHTKERESLLKMIIGMAVGGYRYTPQAKRNEATPDIVNDLNVNGVALDPDTVRKWLKEAAELLPQDSETPDD